MGWLIFWGITATWGVIMWRIIPGLALRIHEDGNRGYSNKKRSEAAFEAYMLSMLWPALIFFNRGRNAIDRSIEQAEALAEAEKRVLQYKREEEERRQQEARDFDRKLRALERDARRAATDAETQEQYQKLLEITQQIRTSGQTERNEP